MNKSEQKAITSVLVLYLTSTILLVSILAYSYYDYQKEQIVKEEKTIMTQDAKKIFSNIQVLHNNLQTSITYPRDNEFKSSIYDIDKKLIFTTILSKNIDLSKQFYQKNGYSYFIYETTPYYLGAAYIVIERKNKPVLNSIGNSIVILTVLVILILITTSLALVKLILKPIRDNLNLLDRFIKDTTHELNTPVSTILTNIELLNSNDIDIKTGKKINRIKTASLTISNLYDDLVFLVLNHSVSSQNETLTLNDIVKQRVEYFDILFSSKDLNVQVVENGVCTLCIDKKKITRVIDNLISNAIKYTKKSTNIKITIDNNSFKIQDQGKGMSEEQISKIFDRYSRFDDTQGGFGIGYNIIHTIINEYNITIKIDSKIDEGTCVTLNF